MKVLSMFIAEKDSIEHDFDMSQILNRNPKPATYVWFVAQSPASAKGQRVLIFHSSESGVLPAASKLALKKYTHRTDMIYCCYPFQTKNRTGDRRIQSHSEKPIHFIPGYENGIWMISLFEKG